MPACLHAREMFSSGIFSPRSTREESLLVRQKQAQKRRGEALCYAAAQSLLQSHVKDSKKVRRQRVQSRIRPFSTDPVPVDPHQISDTLNLIFNLGTGAVIKFLLSVGDEIYDEKNLRLRISIRNTRDETVLFGADLFYQNVLFRKPN